MVKHKIFLLFLGLGVAATANADRLVLAEFSAEPGVSVGDTSSSFVPEDELYRPGDLYAREIGDTRELSWSLGKYTFLGVMDWGQRTNYWAGEHYSDEHFVSLGSKFRIGDTTETYLYHGYGRDLPGVASALYGDFGEGEVARTGLSQILYFADEQASVGVGYEYASGSREQVYAGREGHEVNVSGQFQIGWGFNAQLEAAYGLYSYDGLEGARGAVSSARTNMRAGISRSMSSSLSWGMHYSYVDEEFDLSTLSQSRETWGLNLEYRY
jgi:hypothetical protein